MSSIKREIIFHVVIVMAETKSTKSEPNMINNLGGKR